MFYDILRSETWTYQRHRKCHADERGDEDDGTEGLGGVHGDWRCSFYLVDLATALNISRLESLLSSEQRTLPPLYSVQSR